MSILLFLLALQYIQKESELNQIHQSTMNLREKQKLYMKEEDKEKRVYGLLFEQTVVEMAQQVLRYFSIVAKVKVIAYHSLKAGLSS